MKGLSWTLAVTMVAVALSGCADGGAQEDTLEETAPEEIGQQRVDQVEADVGARFPRGFSFPGQEALEMVRIFINETLGPGTGTTSPEVPDDTGPIEGNPSYIVHDVSEHVPVGQPVEMSIKLKWWGNPGAAGDLDIYINVPGTHDAYDGDSFDESNNWNIVTKFRVVNTVHVEGAPFEVGVQTSNGRIIHPDGMDYSLRVDFAFAEDVLAPGIAYGVTVPQNASRLVFESEPVLGDEHVTGEFMVLDPQDRLLSHFLYDDIGQDTRIVNARMPGEYVMYAPHLRGGFLKVSTDVPNPDFEARILAMEEREEALAEGVLAPAGSSGSFEADGFPLEMHAWIRETAAAGAAGQAILNLTSPDGWVTTTQVTGNVEGDTVGRIGDRYASHYDNSNLASGTWGWSVEGSAAAGLDAGYRYVTYTR